VEKVRVAAGRKAAPFQRGKHLKNIRRFSVSALMLDIAKRLSRIFHENWD